MTEEQKQNIISVVNALVDMDKNTTSISYIDIAKYCIGDNDCLLPCRTDLVVKFKNDIPQAIGDWMTVHNNADNLAVYVGADFVGEDEAAEYPIWQAV